MKGYKRTKISNTRCRKIPNWDSSVMSMSKTVIHRTAIKKGEAGLNSLALSKKRQDDSSTGERVIQSPDQL